MGTFGTDQKENVTLKRCDNRLSNQAVIDVSNSVPDGALAVKAILRQTLVACIASLSILAASTALGWPTPLLKGLLGPEGEIPMTPEDASWMVALVDVGCLFASLPGGICADRFGRKVVLLSTVPIFLLGWSIILYFKTLLALDVARCIHGFANNAVTTVLPLYLGEVAIPRLRGAVISMFYSFYSFGLLLDYAAGPYLSFRNYTMTIASVSILFFMTFLWLPESPYYYMLINDEDKARKTLSWLFSSTEEDTEKGIERMRKGMSEKRVEFKTLIDNAPNRKAMVIIFLNGFTRVFSGLIPLSSFSTLTLASAGGDFFISPDNVTIIMGVMMFVGGLCSSFTLDTFGRKPLLLFSSSISGVTMLLVGTFYLLNSKTTVDVSSFGWVPSIGLILVSASTMLGIFPVTIAYQTELFDTNMRASASVILNMYTTVLAFTALKCYLPISRYFGMFTNFYIFAFACFFSSFLACYVLPETKGKTFEQIIIELNK